MPPTSESSWIQLWRADWLTTAGAIIEINVADLAGSLGGGGRYDKSVGMFLAKMFRRVVSRSAWNESSCDDERGWFPVS